MWYTGPAGLGYCSPYQIGCTCHCEKGYTKDPLSGGCVKKVCKRRHDAGCASTSDECEAGHCADYIDVGGVMVPSNLRCTTEIFGKQTKCSKNEKNANQCHCNCKDGYKKDPITLGCVKK
mgnify:CR=1 FL=1